MKEDIRSKEHWNIELDSKSVENGNRGKGQKTIRNIRTGLLKGENIQINNVSNLRQSQGEKGKGKIYQERRIERIAANEGEERFGLDTD